MKRNLKTLGVACLAVFALSAVAASAASAVEEKNTFSSEAAETHLMGSGGEQVFETAVDTLKCASVEIDEVNTPPIKGKSVESVTAVPIYSTPCKAVEMGLDTHVDFTDCAYIFTAGPTTGEGDAPVHIECPTEPEEQEIHIKVTLFGSQFKCVTVPEQTIPTGAHYENSQVGEDKVVTVEATATGIKYTIEGVCGGETRTDGTYTGKVTVTGTETVENESEEIEKVTVDIFHTEEII